MPTNSLPVEDLYIPPPGCKTNIGQRMQMDRYARGEIAIRHVSMESMPDDDFISKMYSMMGVTKVPGASK